MRGSWGRTLVAAGACALVLAACSAGADDADTEVGGVALELDDDGGTVAVDDERGARAEDEGLVEGDASTTDEDADEGDGDVDDPRDTDAEAEADDTATSSGSSGGSTSTGSSGGSTSTGSSGGASSTGSSGGTGGTSAPTPTATAAPRPTPSPTSPSPTPTPTPTPSPRVLGAGPAVSGSEATGLGDDGWVVISSTGPTEPGDLPPPMRVDVDVLGEGGPIGGATCAVSLRAGDDRGLVAVGRATVTLVLRAEDGTVRRLTRQLLDLDVELGRGGSLQVDPSAPFEVDARELASATCEARFDPAG